MEGLLENQTITIDDHNRATGQPFNKDAAHIHKRRKDGQQADVLVHMDGTIEQKGASSESLKREIKEAFKNETKRQAFFDNLRKASERLLGQVSKEEMTSFAKLACTNLLKAFGLNGKFEKELKRGIESIFQFYVETKKKPIYVWREQEKASKANIHYILGYDLDEVTKMMEEKFPTN